MSLISTEYQEDINKLVECFSDTEKKIKHLEQDTFQLAIPSINQLRYVAYHILKASNPNNYDRIEDVKDELKKAFNHCQRAKFDAIEIWMTYLLEDIRTFEDDYSHIKETQDVIKDYNSDLMKVQKAADELKIIADEEKDREEYYSKIIPHYEELKEISTKFRKSKTLIATLVTENNKNKKKETRKFFITTILSVTVGVIALTMLALKLNIVAFKDDKSSQNAPINVKLEQNKTTPLSILIPSN